MINPKELRIGNWLYGYAHQYENIKSFFQVQSLDEESINPHYPIDTEKWYAKEVELIPLTLEILGKCGFKNGRLNIDITAVRPLYIQSGDNGTVVFYWGEENSQPSPYSIHYEYLHQLQNLYFALTGEELNVEL